MSIFEWQFPIVAWVTGARSWTLWAAPPPLTGVTTLPRPTLALPPPLTVRHPDIILTSWWHELSVRPDLRDTRRVKSAQACSRPASRPALSLFHPTDSITANIKHKKLKKVGLMLAGHDHHLYCFQDGNTNDTKNRPDVDPNKKYYVRFSVANNKVTSLLMSCLANESLFLLKVPSHVPHKFEVEEKTFW